MLCSHPAGLERMERLGFGAIQPDAGMAALSSWLGALDGRAGVAADLQPTLVGAVFFWDRLQAGSPLFAELTQKQQHPPAGAPPSTTAARLDAGDAASPAAPGLPAEAITAAVTEAVVVVLGSDPGPDTPLVGAGVDSLGKQHQLQSLPTTRCLRRCRQFDED